MNYKIPEQQKLPFISNKDLYKIVAEVLFKAEEALEKVILERDGAVRRRTQGRDRCA